MTDSQDRREGSILVRIDGRLDAIDAEASLWNDLRAHVNGSMAEFPETPVYVDLRKVVYADPRCVQILNDVLDEARQHTPVIFLGPGPGLEAMYAITGSFILDPLRMFAPWEEDELSGFAELEEPDHSTLGPQMTKDGEIASALSDALSDLPTGEHHIPAYEEPACFQPAVPPSLLQSDDSSSDDAFEINLDIERAHLESSADGHDRSSRDASFNFSVRNPWRSAAISSVAPPESSPSMPESAPPDSELLQTLARLEKRNRELETKHRESESRLAAEQRELAEQRALAQQERRRLHAEEQNLHARVDEERQRSAAELAEREREIERQRIDAARAVLARESEIEAELNEQLVNLNQRTSDFERAEAIAGSQHQQKLDDLTVREQELERREAQFQVEVPTSAANWLEGARVGTAEGVVLREEFLALVERFTTQGFVDPNEVAAFTQQLDSLAPGIAANLSRLLPHCGNASRDAHWGGILIMTSTLAREEKSSDQRRVALEAALLGTLVQHAPGCQPRSGEVGHDLEEHVLRLLESGFCQLESGFCAEAVRLDLALWRAGLRIASAETLTPHTWGQALSHMLSNLDSTDPACQGLPRVLGTHSVFMPGSWVELSSGDFGQVMGAADGQPERPRVLVLFDFDGTRARPVSPRLFPQSEEDDVTVKRVLDESEFVSLGA